MYPLVSVIVPCLNSELFILDALRSISHQTYKNIEIVAIDDGSTDATVELVKQYRSSSKVNTRFYQQEHRGPAAARNKGIWLAKGEFIAFLDADDCWMPRKLEMQLPLIAKNHACVLSHSSVSIIDKDGRQLGLRKPRLAISNSYLEVFWWKTVSGHPRSWSGAQRSRRLAGLMRNSRFVRTGIFGSACPFGICRVPRSANDGL